VEFECTYKLQSRGLGRSSIEVDNVNNYLLQLSAQNMDI
jgi:hypothetical protein